MQEARQENASRKAVRGMTVPRRYVAYEYDLSALRGALDVTRQLTRHAVNPSRLACRFDMLSEDIALNRIMRATVTRLSRVARSLGNQRRLRELAFAYSDVADIPVGALRWDDVVIDRTNQRWRDLLGLAESPVEGTFPDDQRWIKQWRFAVV